MRRLRFIVGVAGIILIIGGCGDTTPVGVPADAPQYGLLGDPLDLSGLLRCAPLPTDSVTRTVGVEGGTIRVGPLRLVVPPNALAEPVVITAVAPADGRNRVVLGPEGLTFDAARIVDLELFELQPTGTGAAPPGRLLG